MTDKQTLDSYNRGAKNWVSEQPESFYHKYLEKPAMHLLLPDVKGKKILCIGCGTGEEVNYLNNLEAEVIGIDISEGMLKVAKNNFPNLKLKKMDMMKLDFPKDSFDLVYSSLAFHYTDNLKGLFKGIFKILKDKGNLLFSTTHPFFDAADIFELNGEKYHVIGHSRNIETKKLTTYGNYFKENKITQDWKNNFIVNFEHKTVSTWINDLTETKFKILKVVEPRPVIEAKTFFPEKFEIYSKRPGFIIFLAEK